MATRPREFRSTKFDRPSYNDSHEYKTALRCIHRSVHFRFLIRMAPLWRNSKGEAALPQGLARAPADFQNYFLWVVLGEAIMVFMFTMIYARGFAAGGVRAGVALGIMFGIIYTGANLISYGVQAFPGDLVAWYSIAGLIEYAVAGPIVGTIYKTGPAMPV